MRWVVLFLAVLSGCHHVVREGTVTTLEGARFPLESSPALRLIVAGSLDGQSADVTFDPAQPVSFVSGPCARGASLVGAASVPDLWGADQRFPLGEVEGLSISGTPFRAFRAAVAAGKSCVVVLGAPELAQVALSVDPTTRTVTFERSQPAEHWARVLADSGDDGQVLPVARDPRTDWPIVTVRVRQGAQQFDGPFLLSLRDARSSIFEAAARRAGLGAGLDALAGIPGLEEAKKDPTIARLDDYPFDALELAPGFGVKSGSLEREAGAPPHTPVGVLGADAWGRFHATYDVGSGVLVLRRPRVFVSGPRAKCVRDGVTSEEQCFELHSQVTAEGVDVVATVWSPLPEGAQLSLDVEGGSGLCRIGITFSPGDRGRSTQHHFPWPTTAQSLPSCAAAFKGVARVVPGMLEELSLAQCPGTCAWARDVVQRMTSCECQPAARGSDGEAERKLLELLKQGLEQQQLEREREPDDPE